LSIEQLALSILHCGKRDTGRPSQAVSGTETAIAVIESAMSVSLSLVLVSLTGAAAVGLMLPAFLHGGWVSGSPGREQTCARMLIVTGAILGIISGLFSLVLFLLTGQSL
jgi:hypothetical protein